MSAKDKATGKEQSIIVKASSGLSDDEIEKMINDAEQHAEEDKKFQELVNTRNQAEALIHATEKSLKELGDKVEADEKERIETAINELKETIKEDDKTAIDNGVQKLAEASGKLAERVYAAQQAKQSEESASQADSEDSQDAKDEKSDNTVDAEFEEVDNSKK